MRCGMATAPHPGGQLALDAADAACVAAARGARLHAHRALVRQWIQPNARAVGSALDAHGRDATDAGKAACTAAAAAAPNAPLPHAQRVQAADALMAALAAELGCPLQPVDNAASDSDPSAEATGEDALSKLVVWDPYRPAAATATTTTAAASATGTPLSVESADAVLAALPAASADASVDELLSRAWVLVLHAAELSPAGGHERRHSLWRMRVEALLLQAMSQVRRSPLYCVFGVGWAGGSRRSASSYL
jgi:hypothetical protein